MIIDDVKDLLKNWVWQGRELKAKYIFIVLDKSTNTYYPHYTFDDDVDAAWENFSKKHHQPIISFDLNKKVLGVDNATEGKETGSG